MAKIVAQLTLDAAALVAEIRALGALPPDAFSGVVERVERLLIA